MGKFGPLRINNHCKNVVNLCKAFIVCVLKTIILILILFKITLMKSAKKLLVSTGVVFLLLSLCCMNSYAQDLKDINGRTYPVCYIGKQAWTCANLNVDRFRNGDRIPEAKTNEEWVKAAKEGKPAWCYYNNDTAVGRIHGKLYNYYAVSDHRGLTPEGWHIPNNADLSKMVSALGGIDVAGLKLKSRDTWKEQFKGTNVSKFTALPSGARNANGSFLNLNNATQWWSTSGDVAGGPEIWSVGLNSFAVQIGYFKMDKGAGLSVRCLKN
jgi:uncharacterized protein (TIGR02145 family)